MIKRIYITKMDNKQARKFLLKGTNYCSIDLPKYFDFDSLMKYAVEKYDTCKIDIQSAKKCDGVNYKFMSNKDGKYAWRPLQIIHPISYIDLVYIMTEPLNWQIITERFEQFEKLENIECHSIPFEVNNKKKVKANIIENWLENVEKRSIQLSLNYKYIGLTDITDCYGSIYTHSIPWAIHGKTFAKTHRQAGYIGNDIDHRLQWMSYGQTNGIPQGSTLTDFIAEIVLWYADFELAKKIQNIKDYKIIRYRDDYRIFTNSESDLEKILKALSEVLSTLNMKFNSIKTFISDDIISNSLKKDKFDALVINVEDKNKVKWLLKIRRFSLEYQNSSSVQSMLIKFYSKYIKKIRKEPQDVDQLISIVIDIMQKNPKSYMVCAAILSKLLSYKTDNIEYFIDSIKEKFKEIPNTDDINICLQRITLKFNREKRYKTKLAQKIYNDKIQLWNSSWLPFQLDESILINDEEIEKIKPIIDEDEINVFKY